MAVAAIIVRGGVTVPHVEHGLFIRFGPPGPAPAVTGIAELVALERLAILTDRKLSGDAASG